MKQKIFCVGFHKTGTTSMRKALQMLGYKVHGAFGVHDPEVVENVLEIAFSKVHKFDAFQDIPWAVIYKDLDRKFPGNKFILTIRPTKSWIKSVSTHFNNRYYHMHEWIYGVGIVKGNEEKYIARYEKHNKEVIDYFKDRSNDLLVLNLENGDGWYELGNFLNVEVPERNFPHANKAIYRKMGFVKLRRIRWKYRKIFSRYLKKMKFLLL